MIPGTTSKLSERIYAAATTIFPKTDVAYITGSTAIATIVPPYEGFSGLLFVVATTTGLTAVTTGNVQTAVTFTQYKPTTLIYSKLNAKWYSAT